MSDTGLVGCVGGDEGARTPGLDSAIVALSQLSYIPEREYTIPYLSGDCKPSERGASTRRGAFPLEILDDHHRWFAPQCQNGVIKVLLQRPIEAGVLNCQSAHICQRAQKFFLKSI